MPAEIGIAPPGYRLPDSAHIGRVRLQVRDLARSVTYYETVLGLSLLDRATTTASLGVKADGVPLVELVENATARPVPRRGLLGLYHFAVLLPDRAALGRFIMHLAGLGIHAGMSDHLVSEAVYLTDPDGLGIEVYADRPRSSWMAMDRQLAMATNPLDVDSLIEASGGKKWDGAPSETVIGHIHLHVGDIDRAADFYHAGLGLDKIVWSYPGALFMSAGGYHHHLAVNTWAAGAPPAAVQDARLLDWDLIFPDTGSVGSAARSIEGAGYKVDRDGDVATASDPWGITLRLRTDGAG